MELDKPLETDVDAAAIFGGGLEDFNFLVTGIFSCNEDFVLELELDEVEEDDELEELELSELELSVDKVEPFLLFLWALRLDLPSDSSFTSGGLVSLEDDTSVVRDSVMKF